MKRGQPQKKTYRFKVDWINCEGKKETKKYYNYADVMTDIGIPRASFFKMCRGEPVPKYVKYTVETIRDVAYHMVRVQVA